MGENQEVKQNRKSKKIAIIVLIIFVLASIGGYFLYKYLKLEEPVNNNEWGEIYYSYLKEGTVDDTKSKEEIGFEDGMENAKIKFLQLEDEEVPIMIISYDKEGKNYNNMYNIENNEVNYKKLGEQSDIELLYSIEEKLYHLYVYTENETEDVYKPVQNIISEGETKLPEYTITKGEDITQKTVDGDIIIIAKYDEIFIKPEVEQSKEIDFSADFSEEEMKETIKNAIDEYKTKDEVITEKVKQEVAKKEQELINIKAELQKAREEIEKQEEEKTKAEEEAKNPEEDSQVIQAGNYTLKCGAYKGIDYQATSESDTQMEITTVLNSDGTYTQTRKVVSSGKTETDAGTYKLQDGSQFGEYYAKYKILSLSNGSMYIVSANNTFEGMAGAGAKHVYTEN